MHKAKAAGNQLGERQYLTHDLESPDKSLFAASVGSAKFLKMGKCLVDSGASKILTNYHEFEKSEKVGLGDGRTFDAVGLGNVYINMQLKECEPRECIIYKVLYVPKLVCNLFLVRAAAARGKSVKFSNDKCWIYIQ